MATFNTFPITGRKASENPAATVANGIDIVILVQGGVTKKITVDELFALASVSVPTSNKTRLGITKLSVDPVSSSNPIAIGTNDPRVAATGVTAGTYGGTGKILTVQVDTYGKIVSVSDEDLSFSAEDVDGLSLFIQTVGDAKYIISTQSSTISPWVNTRIYKTGEYVSLSNSFYLSLVDGNNFVPGANPAKWEKLNGTELDNLATSKVDKVPGYGLSQEDFTTAEKVKLSTLSEHFKGYYTSEAALTTAIPTGALGDYAFVDPGIGEESKMYIWDMDDSVWVMSTGGPVIPDATETQSGLIELATIAEALARTDDQRAMTALKTIALILDEKKVVNYQANTLGANECSFYMEVAGQVNSLILSGANTGKLKIGESGTYPAGAQTLPFAYSAGDRVFVKFNYDSLLTASANVKLKCKDN